MPRKSERRPADAPILVTESEEHSSASTHRRSEREGYSERTGEDGEQTLAALQEQRNGAGGALVHSTVVLMDARRAASEILAPILTAAGYRALPARSSAEALDVFVREHPHLLIVDDSLLDQSGTELIRRIRALDPSVAVIAQCESLDAGQRRKIRHRLSLHGIHDKADDPERLLELLDSAVDAARRLERTRADQSLRSLILEKLCHDLRSCLHVVHGYTEVLCNDPAASPVEAVLSRLAAASEMARELVQTYLDLAHLESPSVMVRRELVDIDALTADLAAHAGRQIGSRPIRFTLNVPYPGAVVHTDGEKLRAILTQLLSTVIKLSRGGTIELRASFALDRTDFTLTDSTNALERVEPPRLLEPCQLLGDDFLAGTPGQGLALAIALRLSQLLGATLSSDRAAGNEAMFTLSLPATALTGAGTVARPTLH